MAPRESENNVYAKFCGDKQRALWYVMIYSGVVNLVGKRLVVDDFQFIFIWRAYITDKLLSVSMSY